MKKQDLNQEHYFSKNPRSRHDECVIKDFIRGKLYTFVTDKSTFSRTGIDYGTRLLIETMKLKAKDSVLDLGCGYGVIGIVAADVAKDGMVYMVDINERAVDLAKRNMVLNKISNAEATPGNMMEPLSIRKFNVILTNPPVRAGKAVLYAFIENSYRHLKPNGSLYLVIRTKQGARSIRDKMADVFSNAEYAAIHKGYRVIVSKR